MKKNCFKNGLFIAALSVLVLALTGCPEADPESFTDGKIIVQNDSGRNIKVQLAATNLNLSSDYLRYSSRTQISSSRTLKKGKSLVLDFDFSKFQDEWTSYPALMVSGDGGSSVNWYYYNSYTLFQQDTTISVTYDGSSFVQTATYAEFSDYVPLHDDDEACDGEFTFVNDSGKDCWVEYIGFEDDTWNKPVALSPKTLLKSGESTAYKYYLDDYADGEKMYYVGTIYRAENTGTYRWCWQPSANSFPVTETLNEGPIDSDGDGYYNYWKCTDEYAEE